MPRRPSALPTDLPPVFAIAEGPEFGLSRGRLQRTDLRIPFRGLRSAADAPFPTSLRERAEEYAPRLKPWQFFSHETALALIGAPLPSWPYAPRLHVSTHRPRREPRIEGVIGHRLQVRQTAVLEVGGLPVESPDRAWRQTGVSWALDDLIAAADFLSSGLLPLAAQDELLAEVEAMGDFRRGILRRALAESRAGPRSARETSLRLSLTRAGLPEPEINWTLRDSAGIPVADLDLAYPKWKVAPEYDGRVHELDRTQFARDADRWDLIRALGWDHVRILNHHMRPNAAVAVRKVRDALIQAGWRPGA